MKAVQCPGCAREIEIEAGGWPYVFSQIILHVDRCCDLPPGAIRPLAQMAAERYFSAPDAVPGTSQPAG